MHGWDKQHDDHVIVHIRKNGLKLLNESELRRKRNKNLVIYGVGQIDDALALEIQGRLNGESFKEFCDKIRF